MQVEDSAFQEIGGILDEINMLKEPFRFEVLTPYLDSTRGLKKIFVLGNINSGKSITGNIILKQSINDKTFKAPKNDTWFSHRDENNNSSTRNTKKICYGQSDTLVYIDTPGLATHINDDEHEDALDMVFKEIRIQLAVDLSGFLFVLKATKNNGLSEESIKNLTKFIMSMGLTLGELPAVFPFVKILVTDVSLYAARTQICKVVKSIYDSRDDFWSSCDGVNSILKKFTRVIRMQIISDLRVMQGLEEKDAIIIAKRFTKRCSKIYFMYNKSEIEIENKNLEKSTYFDESTDIRRLIHDIQNSQNVNLKTQRIYFSPVVRNLAEVELILKLFSEKINFIGSTLNDTLEAYKVKNIKTDSWGRLNA